MYEVYSLQWWVNFIWISCFILAGIATIMTFAIMIPVMILKGEKQIQLMPNLTRFENTMIGFIMWMIGIGMSIWVLYEILF